MIAPHTYRVIAVIGLLDNLHGTTPTTDAIRALGQIIAGLPSAHLPQCKRRGRGGAGLYLYDGRLSGSPLYFRYFQFGRELFVIDLWHEHDRPLLTPAYCDTVIGEVPSEEERPCDVRQ